MTKFQSEMYIVVGCVVLHYINPTVSSISFFSNSTYARAAFINCYCTLGSNHIVLHIDGNQYCDTVNSIRYEIGIIICSMIQG